MIVSQTKKTQEKLPKKRNFVTKFSKNRLKWLKFTYFVDNTSKCIPYQKFFGKLQLLLTDSQKSRIHLVYLQNFSISRLNFFLKNVEFLEFFHFTLCFRTFQAKKRFLNFFSNQLIKKFCK